ncbi:MAG: glycoside hydrolase family protein, partial [Acaryochloridaceae cyanobacterium CSU_5_19]|nr:glycoside hydrolase family protein [Acaryochloridaceae cyanobacterium CSU_5_19]
MFKSEIWVSNSPAKIDKRFPGRWLGLAAAGIAVTVLFATSKLDPKHLHWPTAMPGKIAPLAMSGGNPYLRALMRTISASEANDSSPYTLLYGGSHIQDLGQHPDRCVPIGWGPNQGRCTTAAGRYQFITTTWLEKAEQYHPSSSGEWIWQGYSFAPEYQDQ